MPILNIQQSHYFILHPHRRAPPSLPPTATTTTTTYYYYYYYYYYHYYSTSYMTDIKRFLRQKPQKNRQTNNKSTTDDRLCYKLIKLIQQSVLYKQAACVVDTCHRCHRRRPTCITPDCSNTQLPGDLRYLILTDKCGFTRLRNDRQPERRRGRN